MGINKWLMKASPKFAVKWFASPYIAGETTAEALATADGIWNRHGLSSTIDLLGEAIEDRAQVEAAMVEYRALIAQLADRTHAWTSVKLSAMGQDIDEDWCIEHADELVKQAAEIGSFVRFDMEDHTTIDSTLRIYRAMRERGHTNVGVVLQSRLWRTPDDIEALSQLDPKPNVRLCIGIYNEPAEVAETDKPKMKQRLLEQLATMLDHGFYVGIATHDEAVIDSALAMLAEKKIAKDAAEFQMLLGVPRAKRQRELLEAGWRVRLYVPYGQDWYPYSSRRLQESPAIVGHVIRNLFTRRGRLS